MQKETIAKCCDCGKIIKVIIVVDSSYKVRDVKIDADRKKYKLPSFEITIKKSKE